MSGFVTLTRSAPFVDYANDIAYVGDDTGKLHKFTGVFLGTPTEAGSPWPVTIASGVILSAPIYDSVSGNIFVGGSNGNLYCVSSTGGALCSTASVTIGTGPILDPPMVDSTQGTVFAEANNASNAILAQVTTSMTNPATGTAGSAIADTMGASGTDLYAGAFDGAYFTSVGTGHMYFCGNLPNAATPALLRVDFDSGGVMSSQNDGSSFQLVTSGNTGTGVDCTPLTEVFNAGQSTDYLFLGVTNNGFNTGTPNCSNSTCIMSFSLPPTSPFTPPTGAIATGDKYQPESGEQRNERNYCRQCLDRNRCIPDLLWKLAAEYRRPGITSCIAMSRK